MEISFLRVFQVLSKRNVRSLVLCITFIVMYSEELEMKVAKLFRLKCWRHKIVSVLGKTTNKAVHHLGDALEYQLLIDKL